MRTFQSLTATVTMYFILCFILLLSVGGSIEADEVNTHQPHPINLSPTTSSELNNFSGDKSESRSYNIIGGSNPPTIFDPSPNLASIKITTTSPTQSQPPSTRTNSPPAPDCSSLLDCMTDLMKPLPLAVIGALAIACFTLLITTLVLACNVCYLRRQLSSSYQVCSEAASDPLSTSRRESVDGGPSETVLMMGDISNGKPEAEEIQSEPKEPEKQQEMVQEVNEVTDQAATEDSAQNEKTTAESEPNQEAVESGE